MKRRNSAWWGLFVAVLLVTMIAAMLVGYVRCSKRGGEYVRGLFWMTCIER